MVQEAFLYRHNRMVRIIGGIGRIRTELSMLILHNMDAGALCLVQWGKAQSFKLMHSIII